LSITKLVGIFLLWAAFTVVSGCAQFDNNWRTRDRSSAGIAPEPAETPEAVVQVYAARAVKWRGIFAVHTWVATKPENEEYFTIHSVSGWRLRRNRPAVKSAPGIPDRRRWGNEPKLLGDLRGSEANAAIAKIDEALQSYPYSNDYTLWPGPNSNTFTAYVVRQVPELRTELPVTAVGKDYPVNGSLLSRAPSGTGYQFSIFGLFGVLVAREEGLEMNLLGLSFGVDFIRPALKLPLIGRIGFPNGPGPRN
jgi:hypothetical protein